MWFEPIRSVIDFSFYRGVLQRSILRAIGYLAYLGLLFSIFSMIVVYVKLSPVIQEAAQWLATSMPVITVADGKATSALTAPLVLHYPRDNRLAILIDTTRTTAVSYDELAKNNIMLCLTQNALYIMNYEQNKVEIRPIAEMNTSKPLVITGDFYPRFAGYFSHWMYPIMFPIFCVVFILWKLLTSVFYSMIGLLINAIAAAELDFPSLFKLAVYAQTPMILLQTIMLPLSRPLPRSVLFPLGFLVTSVYLWQAIRQTKNPESET